MVCNSRSQRRWLTLALQVTARMFFRAHDRFQNFRISYRSPRIRNLLFNVYRSMQNFSQRLLSKSCNAAIVNMLKVYWGPVAPCDLSLMIKGAHGGFEP